jgi:hypothetical protein
VISSVWRSLPESEMRAVLMVGANILRQQAFQVAFVNCDDVIQEITAATPYPTFCNSILPWTFERGAYRTHAQGSNRCRDFQSILGITIKDEEPRSGSKWKCFSQLLDDPRACRMLCDIEVQDATTIVTDDKKAIEHTERDR